MNLENGKTYLIKHSRKGKFSIQIISQDDKWITGIIVDGKANAMLNYNKKFKWDKIELRKSHITSAIEQPDKEIYNHGFKSKNYN